ncbi:MAG: hypothetical protein IPM26_13215 [Saprospiraceae bacterium]|nr:hypothetical protein [Saprospiraceae bacterium]
MNVRLAILTYTGAPGLLPADRALIPLLRNRNITAVPVLWNDKEVDWESFDVLLFRSTWDYYLEGNAFVQWLHTLRNLNIPVINDIQTVLWNMHKFYLRDLESEGVRIIPTLFSESDQDIEIPLHWDKVIIKPAISAGSYKTVVAERSDTSLIEESIRAVAGAVLIQEYFAEVENEGEYSFIFFSGKFSHAVRKIPKRGDFRVQSQFGGTYEKYIPTDQILSQVQKVIDATGNIYCYARVDGILRNGAFYLMELELIEPDLYLDYTENAVEIYAAAVCDSIQTEIDKRHVQNH